MQIMYFLGLVLVFFDLYFFWYFFLCFELVQGSIKFVEFLGQFEFQFFTLVCWREYKLVRMLVLFLDIFYRLGILESEFEYLVLQDEREDMVFWFSYVF